jgi:hypothetical protein
MDYGDKVYLFLNKMLPGEKKVIDYSHPKSKEFIELVKEYMSLHPNGNDILFCSKWESPGLPYAIKKQDFSHNEGLTDFIKQQSLTFYLQTMAIRRNTAFKKLIKTIKKKR